MADVWRGSGAMVERVDIRPPAPMRAFGIAFSVLWFSVPVTATIAAIADGAYQTLFFMVPFMTFGAVIIGSNLRLRVVADENGLRVRNFMKQDSFTPDEIERFVEHSPNGMSQRFGGGVAVLLRSGRLVDLRATQSGPFGRNRRDAHLAELRHWLESTAHHAFGHPGRPVAPPLVSHPQPPAEMPLPSTPPPPPTVPPTPPPESPSFN